MSAAFAHSTGRTQTPMRCWTGHGDLSGGLIEQRCMPTMQPPLHMETIMILKKALALAILTLSAGASHAWTLVYTNDPSGAATSGSIQTLRNAINSGAAVKVLIHRPTAHNWLVNCTNISVRNDTSQAVVCVGNWPLESQLGIGAQFGAATTPAQAAHFVINTLGQYSQTNVRLGDGGIVSSTIVNHQMSWFVE